MQIHPSSKIKNFKERVKIDKNREGTWKRKGQNSVLVQWTKSTRLGALDAVLTAKCVVWRNHTHSTESSRWCWETGFEKIKVSRKVCNTARLHISSRKICLLESGIWKLKLCDNDTGLNDTCYNISP